MKHQIDILGRKKLSSMKSQIALFSFLSGRGECPICDGKGAKLTLEADNTNFEYPMNMLRFKTTSSLNVYVPFNLNGGKVTAIDQSSKNQIRIVIRSLKTVALSRLNELSQAVKTNTKQYLIIIKYADRFNISLERLDETLGKGDFSTVQEELQKLKSKTDDLKAHLNAVSEQNRQNTRIKILTRILSIQLRNVNQLKLVPDSERIKRIEQGQIISFDGSVCLHELCFYDVNIKIYDLPKSDLKACDSVCRNTYSSSMVENAVVIDVTFLKDQLLSKRIQIKQDMKIKIIVNKDKNSFKASFTPFIKYFHNFSQTTISISNGTIQVNTDQVTIVNETFNIESKHRLETATWKNIIERIDGVSYQAGKYMKQTIQNIYFTIATQTDKRLKSSRDRVKNSENSLNSGWNEFNEIDKKFKDSQQNLRIEEDLYRTYLLQEKNNQTSFDSYLKTLDPLFIQRNIEKICKIEKCNETCIPMPVCDTCKDPLILDVSTLKCEAKTEKIRRNIMSPRQQKCPVTQYLFIPVYTGTCKVSPEEQAASDAQLKGSLVAMGAATGGIIGSIIPGVGNVLGAAVGAFVGGILSLFSSCDKSYEVVKKSWVEQKNCVLLVPDVRTITRPFSECFDVMVKAQVGFKVPYTCNCKINDCIAKSPSQDCLSKNKKCEIKRKDFLERTKTVPPKFTKLYKSLKRCQDYVGTSVLKTQSLKKTVQFLQGEYDRTYNKLVALQEEVKFAKQSHDDAKSVLKEESCISNAFSKNKDIAKLIDIKNIQFNITLPLVNNIRLNAQIEYQGKDILIPFVHDLSNENEVSLKAFGRKIIASVLCKQTRKRRSIENTLEKSDISFKPWYVDTNATVSIVKLSCVTLERTLNFLNDAAKKLNKKSNYANDLLMQLQYSSNKLNPSLQMAFSAYSGPVNTSNDVLKANKALLMSANIELNRIQEQVSVKNVLNTWQNEAEITTGFSNISVCLSFNDCIDNAIETLSNLPTIFTQPRKVYTQEILSLQGKFANLYQEQNLIGLSTTAQSIERSIAYLKTISLHCSDPPKVTMIGATDKNLEDGTKFSLKCTAKSKLPVEYYWEHNDKILDEENSDMLDLIASTETQGIYTCIAKNLVGNSTSSQVRITLYTKPKFIEEPFDIIYILPAQNTNSLVLTCNVTNYPQTTIAWYHRPITSDLRPNIIPNESEPLLVINNPIQQKSGYFFCQAFSKYGQIKSREAVVSIVYAQLADAEINVSFDILKTSGITVNSFQSLTTEMLSEIKDVERNMTVRVRKDDKKFRVTFIIDVSVINARSISFPGIFNISLKMRRNIATSLAVLLSKLMKSGYELSVNDGDVVKVDNDTITYGLKLNICKEGFKLHKNGFMCGKSFFQH